MSDDVLASDAEREQAVARLRDASAEGRLTLDELAQRTGAAYVARTHAELAQVTAGLPAPRPQQQVTAARSERPKLVIGVFAPVRRRGRWRLARRTIVISIFAPAFLDLREATLEDGDTAEITVISIFGPVNLQIPEHVSLDLSMVAIFGPVNERGSAGALSPSAPLVRVNGLSLFGPTLVRLG